MSPRCTVWPTLTLNDDRWWYEVVMTFPSSTPWLMISLFPARPFEVVAITFPSWAARTGVPQATGKSSPITTWLRALAKAEHERCGGPGVGAVGMCFTGGFALAMMVDDAVAAPVVAQPSAPFPIGGKRAADLNLSPADLATVRERAAGGCPVLGLRYAQDPAVGTRFETLTRELGEAFVRVEFPGRRHATLTLHRQQEAVDRVLAFFAERLGGSPA